MPTSPRESRRRSSHRTENTSSGNAGSGGREAAPKAQRHEARVAKTKGSDAHATQYYYGAPVAAAGVASRNNHILNANNSSHSSGGGSGATAAAGMRRGSKPVGGGIVGGGGGEGGGRGGIGNGLVVGASGASGSAHDTRPASPPPPPPPQRTKSAPLLELTTNFKHSSAAAASASRVRKAVAEERSFLLLSPHSHTRNTAAAAAGATSSSVDVQDEDEVAGVTGAVRRFHPFSNPELSESLPVINIAVIAAEGVGKSTFIQRAFNLPYLPSSLAAERTIPIDGNVYLVRLLELPIEDIDIDDDETISWPDTIEDKMMPRVDGAVALYDVKDRRSIADLPETLHAITKAALPTVLISNKCDTPPSEREVDPTALEQSAKKAIGDIPTFQISQLNSDGHKRGVFTLLNAIVQASPEQHARSSSASRRRAHSNTVRSLSPRKPRGVSHSRASSENTVYQELKHARVDSSFPSHAQGSRLKVPEDSMHSSFFLDSGFTASRLSVPEDSMHSSFFLEESASEPSATSTRSSLSGDQQQAVAGSDLPATLIENGATFGELVDRLLDQPTSKSDLKFVDIFLALYRNFAAPSQLLEAIVQRFDALERNGEPEMMKGATQLRYLHVLQKWVSGYPGDFAFPRTKRRLQTFTSKFGTTLLFAAAAKEISMATEIVKEDDDTDWAYNDKDREASGDILRDSMSSTASTLIDDPMFSFDTELSGSTLYDDVAPGVLPKIANQQLLYVEQAQRFALQLEPIPRVPLTKIQWRILMELPDDVIAKELTRIDWIMFSAIRPRDLVRQVSLNQEQKANCKNLSHVVRMTEHFNQLAFWVANYVLLRDKPKHRALMLEKFMRIARKLREMNNYNALGAIIAGVKSTSVHRLMATRELLPPTAGKDWLKLEILMAPSKSHSAYRLAWENSSSERIPYLPLHRRDIATAEEGNKTFIGDEKDGRINWKKFEIMGDVIVSLQRAQGMPYKDLGGVTGMREVKDLVLDVRLIKDEEDLYDRSVQCEPPANAAGGPSAKFKDFFKRSWTMSQAESNDV